MVNHWLPHTIYTQCSEIYIHKYSWAWHLKYPPYIEVPQASLTHQDIAPFSQLRILVLRMSLVFLWKFQRKANVLWPVQQALYSPTPLELKRNTFPSSHCNWNSKKKGGQSYLNFPKLSLQLPPKRESSHTVPKLLGAPEPLEIVSSTSREQFQCKRDKYNSICIISFSYYTWQLIVYKINRNHNTI